MANSLRLLIVALAFTVLSPMALATETDNSAKITQACEGATAGDISNIEKYKDSLKKAEQKYSEAVAGLSRIQRFGMNWSIRRAKGRHNYFAGLNKAANRLNPKMKAVLSAYLLVEMADRALLKARIRNTIDPKQPSMTENDVEEISEKVLTGRPQDRVRVEKTLANFERRMATQATTSGSSPTVVYYYDPFYYWFWPTYWHSYAAPVQDQHTHSNITNLDNMMNLPDTKFDAVQSRVEETLSTQGSSTNCDISTLADSNSATNSSSNVCSVDDVMKDLRQHEDTSSMFRHDSSSSDHHSHSHGGYTPSDDNSGSSHSHHDSSSSHSSDSSSSNDSGSSSSSDSSSSYSSSDSGSSYSSSDSGSSYSSSDSGGGGSFGE